MEYDVSFDNESFYAIDGTKITHELIVQRMIELFNQKYPNSQITDFNDGSEIRNLLESISSAIYHLEMQTTESQRISFISTAYGSWLDLHGADWNAPRDLGHNSTGTVTFTIPEPVDYNIIIPYGTVLVSNENGAEFTVIQDAELRIGTTSIEATVISNLYGDYTNAPANTVTIFRDEKPSPLLSVTNNSAFTGGTNREEDVDYRARLLSVKGQDSFGSKDYYNRLATGVEGVHDIILTESSNNKTAKIIVNGNDKPVTDEVLANVISEFTDESKIVYDHSFEVVKTSYTTLNLEFTVSVVQELSEDSFNSILTNLLNGGGYLDTAYVGLSINEKLKKYDILNCIESLIGVIQVTEITRDEEDFDTVITPDTNTVFKLGTLTITQEVAED